MTLSSPCHTGSVRQPAALAQGLAFSSRQVTGTSESSVSRRTSLTVYCSGARLSL